MNCGRVIGIYGVSGSGKSHTLSTIQTKRSEWRCLEGRQVIEDVLLQDEGGKVLSDFLAMSKTEKTRIRLKAAKRIRAYQGVTIVSGHCSFPTENNDRDVLVDKDKLSFEDVFTNGDAETYDAILYLDKHARDTFHQREGDQERKRPFLTEDRIEEWIQHEKGLLRHECKGYDIHFSLVHNEEDIIRYIHDVIVSPMVVDAQLQSKENLRCAVHELPGADIYLLIDGDRTITPQDTGRMFFESLGCHCDDPSSVQVDPLKKIFQRFPSYNFEAFLAVAMLYGAIVTESQYDQLSSDCGISLPLYPAWKDFLLRLPENIHPILISCSNREIWRASLETNGLVGSNASTGRNQRMSILAGNHLGRHNYLMDGEGKALVAKELRKHCPGCKIISFGDSVLDVPMLKESDRGYIVIDHPRHNISVQEFITSLRVSSSQRIHQLMDLSLDEGASVSFWHVGLPVGSLSSLLAELEGGTIHSVKNYAHSSVAASILAGQTRRADLRGPDLQKVHVDVGMFLADRLMEDFPFTDLLMTQTYAHVQGSTFDGLAASGNNVIILPLMRGGEPLSRGVYQRFPDAQLVHYNSDDDPLCITTVLVQKQEQHHHHPNPSQSNTGSDISNEKSNNLIIVDSVINRGDSIRRVLNQLDHKTMPSSILHGWNVFVLTCVMQQVAADTLPQEFPRVRFLALRVSDNQYTGKGGTDTGNRLFGTL